MVDSNCDGNTIGARGLMHPDRALRERVRGEYLEMPGLRLTVVQAARLFDLELTLCSQVLHTLVTDGMLWTNGREFLGNNVGRRCI
jgi:hypothetical protein